MAVLASKDLREDLGDLNETRKAIENAENRARLDHRKTDSKVATKNNREYAQALHREADQLYRSGDYESALVLYHRAANLYPKDSSHGVAARRTAATISSCNNPSKALRKVLPNSGNGERLTVALCPETAAIMANEKLKNSPEPSSVSEVLSYFDTHKSYWRSLPSPRISTTQLARSRMMLKQLNNLAETSLKNLQSAFDSGKMSTALKIAQELLVLSGGFQDPTRYQIAAYHYLSLVHVALGRHDRAVCNVSRLVRLSKGTDNIVQICRSLVTLGKVHLSFGHLDAAAKAWEHLSKDLKEPIPVAWIRHEIGRCYLETGKHAKAMEMGFRCVEAAVKGNSKKWMLNGRLLLGQSLAKLGRFVESLEELQIAAKITEEEGDTPMLSYIRDLIDQVAGALRRIPFENGCWEVVESTISAGEKASELSGLFEEAVITTVFSQRKTITECQAEESSAEDASSDTDDEITMHSGKTISLVTYRESTARSNLEEEALQESSTFRVAESSQVKDIPVSLSCSSSSSSSSSTSLSSTEAEEVAEEKAKGEESQSTELAAKVEEPSQGEDTARTFEDSEGVRAESDFKVAEESLVLDSDSKASLRSTYTSATYVVEGECSVRNDYKETTPKKLISGEEEKRVGGTTMQRENSMMANCMKLGEQSGDMLSALRVIEELGEKDEVELLEMLKDMLLTGDGRGQLGDLGNSGDGFQTSRSGKDRRNEVASSRSTRHASLPASPRKCDAHGDSRNCDTSLQSN